MDTTKTFEFNIGDKLYCYYGKLLYEAKCLKRRIASDGVVEYFIHYCGFKTKFDEWVDYDRVLEINDTNIVHKSTLEYYQLQKKRKYTKANDSVNRNSPETCQDSEICPTPKKKGRPFKKINIPKCISSCKTPESDFGKIDSKIKSTEIYCTRSIKAAKIAKCLSSCETPESDIGKIDSEVQSTKTYCTPVPLKSIETPRSNIKKSSVPQIASTEFIKENKKYKERKNIANNFTPSYSTDVPQPTSLQIKKPPLIADINCTYSKANKDEVNKNSPKTNQHSETSLTPRKRGRPIKKIKISKCISSKKTPESDAKKIDSKVQSTKTYYTRSVKTTKIAKCLSSRETPESDIGKINSEVQSTKIYCTPVPLKSIETPSSDIEKSSVSQIASIEYKIPKCISSCETPESDIEKIDSEIQPTETYTRSVKTTEIAKCISSCETTKSDIGKIDSEIQSTKTYCTPVPLKSIETPSSDIEKSSVSQIASIEFKIPKCISPCETPESDIEKFDSEIQPPETCTGSVKTAEIAKCISSCETLESDIGKIDSEIQSTKTYCTPIPLKSIETPMSNIENCSVSKIKSTNETCSSNELASITAKLLRRNVILEPINIPQFGIEQISFPPIESTEFIKLDQKNTERINIAKNSALSFLTGVPQVTLIPIKKPPLITDINHTYAEAEDRVNKKSPKTSQHSKTSPIPRQKDCSFKNTTIPKCISSCETPESDIGKIDSEVQSTETYCTGSVKTTEIAKCISSYEIPKSDIGKIDSEVQLTKTYFTPSPLKSIETPRSDIEESSVSKIELPKSSSEKLVNNLINLFETNFTLDQQNTHVYNSEHIRFPQIEFTEFIKEDKKYTESINIAKHFTLLFSTGCPQTTLPPIRIPPLITDIINDDWIQHDVFNKVLDFPSIHTVADLIYDFIESQRKLYALPEEKALLYGVNLLNLFNYIVNKQLMYRCERKFNFPNKSFSHFFKIGRANKSRIYVLKEFLERKKVWCYAYGPVHLMRLFVCLSKHSLVDDKELAVSAGSYDFLQFVENNVDKYFSERQYVSTSDSNIDLNSPSVCNNESPAL